jgi:hypothetical protein
VRRSADDNLENLQSKLNEFTTVIIGYHIRYSLKSFDFSQTELQN